MLATALATFGFIAAWAGAARASDDRVVVESYEGERSSGASAALQPVYADLIQRGFTVGPALATRISERASHDAGMLSASEVVDAQRQVDDAYQRFIEGDYDRALAQARAAITIYDGAAGHLAREPALRDLRYKALLIAARSSEVKGSAQDAFGLMAEAIRSFPDRPVSGAQFDPTVNALYNRVRRELDRQGAGSLEVTLDDPGVNVFVDEQFVGAGSTKREHLAPGRYRVYVSKGQDVGRVHDVDVAPGTAATIIIDWQLDRALRTSGSLVALQFDMNTSIDTEARSASQLARAIGAKTIVVLSVRPINGRSAVAGYAVAVESQTRTFGAVQIEPVSPSADTFAQLAALLAGDRVDASGLITTEPVRALDISGDAALLAELSEPHWYDDRWGWVVTGTGALLLGGGVFAETRASSLDDQASRETSQVERQRLQDSASSYRTTGGVLAITGGAVLVAGIVRLVLTPSRPRATVTAGRTAPMLDLGPGWVGIRESF